MGFGYATVVEPQIWMQQRGFSLPVGLFECKTMTRSKKAEGQAAPVSLDQLAEAGKRKVEENLKTLKEKKEKVLQNATLHVTTISVADSSSRYTPPSPVSPSSDLPQFYRSW